MNKPAVKRTELIKISPAICAYLRYWFSDDSFSTKLVRRDVPTLKLPPLQLGERTIETPVILAPMAGITNSAFRRLCREYGGGLYVAEMVTSRALVERTPESLRIISHDDDEKVRSVQLYGVDPDDRPRRRADGRRRGPRGPHRPQLRMPCAQGHPQGRAERRCRGRLDLFTSIVGSAVQGSRKGNVPLTIKMRKGIDADHLTYLEPAGSPGMPASPPSRCTPAPPREFYSGHGRLVGHRAAARGADRTSRCWATATSGQRRRRAADGRARPGATAWWWAAAAWAGRGCSATSRRRSRQRRPVACRPSARWPKAFYRHAELLVEFFEDEGGHARDPQARRLVLQGLRGGRRDPHQAGLVTSLEVLREMLGQLDLDLAYPGADAEGPRGRAGSPKKPALPKDWLLDRDDGRRAVARDLPRRAGRLRWLRPGRAPVAGRRT